MSTFFTAIITFLSSRWSPVAFIITAMGIIYSNFLGIVDKIDELIVMVDGVVRPGIEAAGVSVSTFAFFNYVFPLDLVIAYLNLYLPFFIICCGIRFVKGWIPLVAS